MFIGPACASYRRFANGFRKRINPLPTAACGTRRLLRWSQFGCFREGIPVRGAWPGRSGTRLPIRCARGQMDAFVSVRFQFAASPTPLRPLGEWACYVYDHPPLGQGTCPIGAIRYDIRNPNNDSAGSESAGVHPGRQITAHIYADSLYAGNNGRVRRSGGSLGSLAGLTPDLPGKVSLILIVVDLSIA